MTFAILLRAFSKHFFEFPHEVAGIIESHLGHYLFDREKRCLEQLTCPMQPHRFQKSHRRNACVPPEEVSQSRIRQIYPSGHVSEANVLFAVREKMGGQTAHPWVHKVSSLRIARVCDATD
jgi:hypothetical protein